MPLLTLLLQEIRSTLASIDRRIETISKDAVSESPIMTFADAAEWLGVSDRTMRRLVDRGATGYVDIGTGRRERRRIHLDALEAYVRSQARARS